MDGRRGHRGGLFQEQPSHNECKWTAGVVAVEQERKAA